MITRLLQAQERAHAQADVVALGAGGAHVGAFHSTKLLDATMIMLDRPSITGPAGARQRAHLKSVAGPPFNVAVGGDNLEHANQSVAFQMDEGAVSVGLDPRHSAQAAAVRVYLAVGLQPSQPDPAPAVDHLQIRQTAIPAIENHALWHKPTLVRGLEQRLKVIVFGQPVSRLVIEAIIHRDMAVTLRPEPGDHVDTLDYGMVLARPMPLHQFDFLGIGLVQSRIIDHPNTALPLNLPGSFTPKRRGVRLQAMQETGKGIVCRHQRLLRLYSCSFGRAVHLRGSDQKIDVVFVSHFRRVHTALYTRSQSNCVTPKSL